MRQLILITALLAVTAVSHVSAADCPESCSCVTYGISDTLYCVNAGLTSPPAGDWPEIDVLVLSGNNISELDENSFAGYPNLRLLSLRLNQLTTFDFNVFASLPLAVLDVEYNSISTIIAPENVEMTNLWHLYMRNNQISDFDPDTFARVAPNLDYFGISYNPIKVVRGKALLNHPKIEFLGANGIDASEISAATFPALPNLRELHLEEANISDITGVFVNMNIEYIVLINDNMRHVTAGSFSPEHAMKNLYMYDSQLEQLDLEAVQEALGPGSTLEFQRTPLACNCGYEDIAKWAKETGVRLNANCGSVKCDFARK